MTAEEFQQNQRSTLPSSHRVRDASHLVGLLADQLEALEQGDYARLRELNGMRLRLAEEMREEEDGDEALIPWLLQLVGQSMSRVEEWIQSDRLTRDEVALLRDASLPLTRGLPRTSSGTYLSLDPGSTRVDVRL